MPNENSRSRARRNGVESEEERAWISFYQRVEDDPAIAAEVMALLESDQTLKNRHLALYLGCKESLRRHKARANRNRRIGLFVRGIFQLLLIRPWTSLRRTLHASSEIAIECLPDPARAPVNAVVRPLQKEMEFNSAITPATATQGSRTNTRRRAN